MASNKKVRVGILGFGLSGKVFHAGLLREYPKFEIHAVASSRPDDVRRFLPGVKVYADSSLLISAPDIDLVINCAPNAQHFSLSAEALRAGKHVVVEKPFVNSSREGQELISLAKASNRFVTVFQNRRWDGDFLTLKALIESGQMGVIQLFESHMDRWRPNTRPERWREQAKAGSGILFDLGAHLIDQALVLFGQPDSLWADVVSQKSGATTDDYFHLILKYGPRRVILHSSSFAAATPRFQVFGSKAAFVKYTVDPQESQLRDEMSIFDSLFGRESELNFGRLRVGEQKESSVPTEPGRYLEFYDRLHAAIVDDDESLLPVQPLESLRVIELIEAAFESSSSGQSVDLKSGDRTSVASR